MSSQRSKTNGDSARRRPGGYRRRDTAVARRRGPGGRPTYRITEALGEEVATACSLEVAYEHTEAKSAGTILLDYERVTGGDTYDTSLTKAMYSKLEGLPSDTPVPLSILSLSDEQLKHPSLCFLLVNAGQILTRTPLKVGNIVHIAQASLASAVGSLTRLSVAAPGSAQERQAVADLATTSQWVRHAYREMYRAKIDPDNASYAATAWVGARKCAEELDASPTAQDMLRTVMSSIMMHHVGWKALDRLALLCKIMVSVCRTLHDVKAEVCPRKEFRALGPSHNPANTRRRPTPTTYPDGLLTHMASRVRVLIFHVMLSLLEDGPTATAAGRCRVEVMRSLARLGPQCTSPNQAVIATLVAKVFPEAADEHVIDIAHRFYYLMRRGKRQPLDPHTIRRGLTRTTLRNCQSEPKAVAEAGEGTSGDESKQAPAAGSGSGSGSGAGATRSAGLSVVEPLPTEDQATWVTDHQDKHLTPVVLSLTTSTIKVSARRAGRWMCVADDPAEHREAGTVTWEVRGRCVGGHTTASGAAPEVRVHTQARGSPIRWRVRNHVGVSSHGRCSDGFRQSSATGQQSLHLPSLRRHTAAPIATIEASADGLSVRFVGWSRPVPVPSWRVGDMVVISAAGFELEVIKSAGADNKAHDADLKASGSERRRSNSFVSSGSESLPPEDSAHVDRRDQHVGYKVVWL